MKKVLIVQSQIKRYRLPFFLKLRDALLANDIQLRVAYADPLEADGRSDNCDLPPGLGTRIKPYKFYGRRLVYFPLLREVAKTDLVIAEQANRHLQNYLLLLLSITGVKRVAFWGLGENKDENRSELSEWIRRRIANKVDWWFAYTDGTKDYLTSNGVARGRITVVRNAIDTREIVDTLGDIDDRELSAAKSELGIEGNGFIGLFLGALLPDKGVALLLEAAELAKKKIAGLHVLFVGGGEERAIVEKACRVHPWIHLVGPKFGREKILLLKMADAMLLPGRVGLAILDGFAAGLPLLTTDVPYHGPEIEYLENMRNGMVFPSSPEDYASGIVSFFSSQALRDKLAKGARSSSLDYSIDAMVGNFEVGIQICLRLRNPQVATIGRTA